jgi:hypothetical protein
MIRKLKQFYNAQPFRSFVIHLNDGRQIPVYRRDFMLIAPSGCYVIVVQPNDRTDILDLQQMADLKVKPLG